MGHRRIRSRLAVAGALGLLVVAAPACGGRHGDGKATCARPPAEVDQERPVAVPYRGPALDSAEAMAEPTPRLVVQVTNDEPSVERVRLAFDGVTALDVDLPAGLGCGSGEAVYSIAYDLEPGPVEVALDLQGSRSTSTIDVPASGTVWAVVDVQSRREWGDITVYETQPGWG